MTQVPPRQLTPRPVSHDQAAQLLAEIELAAGLGAFIWYPEDAPTWSDGFYRVLGLEPGDPDVIAAHFYERVHPQDLPALTATWQRATAGETVSLTYRVLRAEGDMRWVDGRCIPSLDESGRVVRVLGTVKDVTEKHEASIKLTRANAVLRDTQKAAGVGSHLFRARTDQVEWSDELYRILGLDPATPLTPQLAASFTHPDDLEKQRAWSERVARGEVMPPLLVRVIRADGALRYLETRASCVDLTSGPTVQGVSIDVTARHEMEERLRHAAKMEAVGTLAAGIAHDFNNYLGVLTMHLDSISEDGSAELDAMVSGARHATEQCSEFTRQLLTFARKQPAAPRELDVVALVGDAGRLIQGLLGASVIVSVKLPEAPILSHVDPGQLESALVNLAANARDAMPRGGKLSLEVSRLELTRADARLDRDCAPGHYALIRVSDTGSGISPEHLSRIFEPYFTTKAAGQGTGLGLAMAYGSVRQHQGFMRVKSTLGQGTLFEVYLPVVETRERRTPSASRTVVSQRGKLTGRVLLVEDVDPLRELAVRVVQSLGVEVVSAADGLIALEHARAAATPFDVVVTDLMMPGMTGGELARAIAELWPRTKFVFMTGYVEPAMNNALIAEHAGCAMLRKPFRSHDLAETVRSLLLARSTPDK